MVVEEEDGEDGRCKRENEERYDEPTALEASDQRPFKRRRILQSGLNV